MLVESWSLKHKSSTWQTTGAAQMKGDLRVPRVPPSGDVPCPRGKAHLHLNPTHLKKTHNSVEFPISIKHRVLTGNIASPLANAWTIQTKSVSKGLAMMTGVFRWRTIVNGRPRGKSGHTYVWVKKVKRGGDGSGSGLNASVESWAKWWDSTMFDMGLLDANAWLSMPVLARGCRVCVRACERAGRWMGGWVWGLRPCKICHTIHLKLIQKIVSARFSPCRFQDGPPLQTERWNDQHRAGRL